MKIGSVVVEIFGEIGRFCRIISNVQISHTSISGVTGPKFTIFVCDVERWFALFTCLSILRCDIQLSFKMPGSWMKVTLQILPKISCHGNVSKGIKKRSGSRKFTQIPFIWWKDRENRSSRSWDNLSQVKKEDINAGKIISPVGRFAERAKEHKKSHPFEKSEWRVGL